MKEMIKVRKCSITNGTMPNNSRNFIFTIFGASGDLADLKLFPALFELYSEKKFADEIYIVGYARSDLSRSDFQDKFRISVEDFCKEEGITLDKGLVERLLSNVYYFQGSYDKQVDFENYIKFVDEIGCSNYEQELFHFSVPPRAYDEIIENIAKVRTGKSKNKVKLLVEKPFGDDLETAMKLEHLVKRYFSEEQIYMIDHYLGKQAIRSIVNLRMHNRILNLLFSGREISNIQISALEPITVENRLNYYDNTGALKDMFQSHLLQLLSIVMMDLPINLNCESFASSKENVIDNLEIEDCVFGQYEGYCKDHKNQCNLNTDTFFALKLKINKQRWQGVPIYIRSGKAMDRKQTSVVIEFKNYPHQDGMANHNRMIFEVDPHPSINLSFMNTNGDKNTGNEIITDEELDCGNRRCLSPHALLFHDAIRNRRDFFVTFKQAIKSWKLTEEFLKGKKIVKYRNGSSYVGDSIKLIEADNNKWFDIHE